jgi:hypothetical protein
MAGDQPDQSTVGPSGGIRSIASRAAWTRLAARFTRVLGMVRLYVMVWRRGSRHLHAPTSRVSNATIGHLDVCLDRPIVVNCLELPTREADRPSSSRLQVIFECPVQLCRSRTHRAPTQLSRPRVLVKGTLAKEPGEPSRVSDDTDRHETRRDVSEVDRGYVHLLYGSEPLITFLVSRWVDGTLPHVSRHYHFERVTVSPPGAYVGEKKDDGRDGRAIERECESAGHVSALATSSRRPVMVPYCGVGEGDTGGLVGGDAEGGVGEHPAARPPTAASSSGSSRRAEAITPL